MQLALGITIVVLCMLPTEKKEWKLKKIIDLPHPSSSALFSPSGRFLATVVDGRRSNVEVAIYDLQAIRGDTMQIFVQKYEEIAGYELLFNTDAFVLKANRGLSEGTVMITLMKITDSVMPSFFKKDDGTTFEQWRDPGGTHTLHVMKGKERIKIMQVGGAGKIRNNPAVMGPYLVFTYDFPPTLMLRFVVSGSAVQVLDAITGKKIFHEVFVGEHVIAQMTYHYTTRIVMTSKKKTTVWDVCIP